MFVASDEATAGSVMAKQLLIWPSSRGSSHCFFCLAVPYLHKATPGKSKTLAMTEEEHMNPKTAPSRKHATRLPTFTDPHTDQGLGC